MKALFFFAAFFYLSLWHSRVRKLPPLLFSIPLCAVQCRLHGVHPPAYVSPGEVRLSYQPIWPQAALTILASALSGQRITAIIKVSIVPG